MKLSIRGRYSIIYADPPWNYRDKREGRGGAENYYNCMKPQGIMDLKIDPKFFHINNRVNNYILENEFLPIRDIAAENSILFMWCTWPQYENAVKIMNAWGFDYKTLGFIWLKKNKIADSWFWGGGSYTRSNSEYCLIGTRGKVKRISASVHQVITSRYTGIHSDKPPEVRERIVELMGDLPRIELFAREKVIGWDAWGDEV